MAVINSVIYLILVGKTGNTPLFLIGVLGILASGCDISWYYVGLEDFRRIVLRNLLLKVIDFIFIFSVVKSSNDVYKYAFGIYVINIICNISLWKGSPILCRSKKKFCLDEVVKSTFPFFLSTTMMQVYPLIDRTMLGYMVEDKEQSGYYSQIQIIVKAFIMITVSIGTVTAPRISYYHRQGENEKIARLVEISLQYVGLIAIPIVVGLISIADLFVKAFLGQNYIQCVMLLKVFSPYLIFNSIINVINTQLLIPTNKQYIVTCVMCGGALINITLNLFLINRYYALGAVIATLFSEFLIMLILLIYIRGIFQINFKEISQSILKYIVASSLMYCSVRIFSDDMMGIFMTLLIKISVGIIVYFISLIIMKEKLIYKFLSNINCVKDYYKYKKL